MNYFLNLRSVPRGGSVSGHVKFLDGAGLELPDPEVNPTTLDNFKSAIQGHEVLLIAHGFNVDQASGVASIGHWSELFDETFTPMSIGVLWPGDAKHLSALSYPWEGDEAEHSGQLLARFINQHMTGATFISLASHSLGARVVLECIRHLERPAKPEVRRLLLMAPAVDDDTLTKAYKDSAAKVQEISILGSKKDNVLKLAFPLGNPLMGIFGHGHPYWHAALGREGPHPAPANMAYPSWRIPDAWEYGHSDYFGKEVLQTKYTQPVNLPPPNTTDKFPPDTPKEL